MSRRTLYLIINALLALYVAALVALVVVVYG